MTNPYLLPAQSVVSFSGGRTSGYMLRHVLDAHDEAGAPRPVVIFNNTGKEREETLQFVEECAIRWDVPIRWLEYRYDAPHPLPMRDEDYYRIADDEQAMRWAAWHMRMGPARAAGAQGKHTFAEVSFPVASRDGEPFQEAIAARGFLPNPVTRFCTAELKIRTTNRFVRRVLGWSEYTNAIGLRADEVDRVMKMRRRRTVRVEQTLFGKERHVERGAEHPPGETPVQPLYDAGASLEDVMQFWADQPFDLRLRQDEGNCDLCFLKGGGKIVNLIRERPESADWWALMEARVRHTKSPETARFRADRPPYKELKLIALDDMTGPGWLSEEMWARPGCDEGRCTD